VSSGYIRLTNKDVQDHYSRVTLGTRVLFFPRYIEHLGAAV
jgi:lipoprotein-anchoring transpeptidase ErfK/SrfK